MRDKSVLNEVLPPDERVIEAVVARYQRIAPAVLRFARTISDNEDLQVRLGSQAAAADGDIVLDPRVFQAAYARSAPVTPTEVALTSALHEVVHMMTTNFEEKRPLPQSWLPTPEDDAQLPLGADPEPRAKPQPEPKRLDPMGLFDFDEPGVEELLDLELEDEEEADVPEIGVEEAPVSLLDALNEAGGGAAEALFLSIEDARQEVQQLAPYAGVRSVLTDLYRAASPDAFRAARPLGQFALACFMTIGGYSDRDSLQRRMAPHSAAALDDAAGWLDEAMRQDDPWEVAGIAIELLKIARIRQLVTPEGSKENSAAQKARNEADKSAIAETVDAVRIVTPTLQDMETYEQTRQASQSVSAEKGKKGEAEHAGDPATDQLVRVSEAPTVYLPTGQSGKLIVDRFPTEFRSLAMDGRNMLEQAARQWGVAQRRVSGELYPLFLANQRRGLRTGYDAGDLSPYTALLLGAGLYERMFERRDLPTRRSYGVSLLVDGSASMLQPRPTRGGRKAPWALAAATLGAWTLARLCDELQIEFEVALFNRSFVAKEDDTEASYNSRRADATGALRRSQGGNAERLTRTVNHYLLKSFDDRWRQAEDSVAGLFYMAADPQEAARKVRLDRTGGPPLSMFEKAANVDEYNLAYAAKRLAARHVTHRIIVVLADGMTRGSVNDLAECVHEVELGGATVLGIGIGDDTVRTAYSRHQIVEAPETLAAAMVDGVRSSLLKTLAGTGGDGWWLQASRSAAPLGTSNFAQTMRSINA
ncbi:MAG: hypothetical protein HKN91_02575 [Acidimicrobiia bacterium]|nr:hypothetical protein [Acidimicrobiia bacterium]